eukprot:2332604-Pleurochrysis_carterae.AAC.2
MLDLERDKVGLELQVKSQQENVVLRKIRAKVAGEYQSLLHEQFMQGLAWLARAGCRCRE